MKELKDPLLLKNLLRLYNFSQPVTFGEQVSTTKKFAVATIRIHTVNGGQIPVSVLVLLKLAAPVCNSIHAHLIMNNLPYLSGLTLAHR